MRRLWRFAGDWCDRDRIGQNASSLGMDMKTRTAQANRFIELVCGIQKHQPRQIRYE